MITTTLFKTVLCTYLSLFLLLLLSLLLLLLLLFCTLRSLGQQQMIWLRRHAMSLCLTAWGYNSNCYYAVIGIDCNIGSTVGNHPASWAAGATDIVNDSIVVLAISSRLWNATLWLVCCVSVFSWPALALCHKLGPLWMAAHLRSFDTDPFTRHIPSTSGLRHCRCLQRVFRYACNCDLFGFHSGFPDKMQTAPWSW